MTSVASDYGGGPVNQDYLTLEFARCLVFTLLATFAFIIIYMVSVSFGVDKSVPFKLTMRFCDNVLHFDLVFFKFSDVTLSQIIAIYHVCLSICCYILVSYFSRRKYILLSFGYKDWYSEGSRVSSFY